MRYIGIDYGTKRVGIALSDTDGNMAFPHSVLENNDKLLDEILLILQKEEVAAIVIGHSTDRDGGDNPIQKSIDAFIAHLKERTNLPISLEEERYTTQAALQIQGRTDKTDASAAALILDSHLTRVKNTS